MILGVPANRIGMPGDIQPAKPYSIFGVISIAFPLLGIPVAHLIGAAYSVNTDGSGQIDYFGAFGIFMFFSVLVILSGSVSAIVALIRRERFLLLSLSGLVLNITPVVWWLFVF